jgi:hypothetical protein
MNLANLTLLLAALALANCGGAGDDGSLDLGSGLRMTADGFIVQKSPLPDFAFASAADWKRYEAESALDPHR